MFTPFEAISKSFLLIPNSVVGVLPVALNPVESPLNVPVVPPVAGPPA